MPAGGVAPEVQELGELGRRRVTAGQRHDLQIALAALDQRGRGDAGTEGCGRPVPGGCWVAVVAPVMGEDAALWHDDLKVPGPPVGALQEAWAPGDVGAEARSLVPAASVAPEVRQLPVTGGDHLQIAVAALDQRRCRDAGTEGCGRPVPGGCRVAIVAPVVGED